MPISFFPIEKNYKLLTIFAAITGIILITKSKKTLTRFFEQFVMPRIGDIVQAGIETNIPHTFICNREDNSTFNQNCYHYLSHLERTMPQAVREKLPEVLQGYLKSYCVEQTFSPYFAYGNMYKALFLSLEDHILECVEGKLTSEMRQFIQTLFANDNHVLDSTFNLIKPALLNKTHNIAELRDDVILRVKSDESQSGNVELPSYKRTHLSRGINISASTVKEQYTTNIPTIKHYAHHNHLSFKEYRFGTQGQRVNNLARVNPFFRAWCCIQQPTHPGPIAHIYFNNLTIDRDTVEGRVVEVPWSKALHHQEEETPSVAFVTLPADKGLLSKSALTINQAYTTPDTLALFTRIAMEKEFGLKIKDFHISPYIRTLIYSNETQEEIILKALLQNTLNALKLDKTDTLTARERQACYFHFIKFELTDTIINQLKPDSINFACKDAIDRAGVSSLYYNIMKSIEIGHPMSQDEFLKGLHAAPASVKGRALNHHFELLHNVLSLYVKANQALVSDKCPWLIGWCKQFDPNIQVALEENKTSAVTI